MVDKEELEYAKNIVKVLKDNNHDAYFVGGFVRDHLLGTSDAKDIDVVTSATPDQIMSSFDNCGLVGKSFGVVIVNGIDVATFRRDGVYSDGRHPDTVEFSTSAEEDSCRRDFTINALYMDPFTNKVLDFHGGLIHLDRGVIKCVGNPVARFTEDSLRMVRAVRFASKLQFKLHDETFEAIRENLSLLENVSAERIGDELRKALTHDVNGTINNLESTGMTKYLFPNLKWKPHTLPLLGREQNVQFSLAAFFVNFEVTEIEAEMKRFKFSNEDQKNTMKIVNLFHFTKSIGGDTSTKKTIREPMFRNALKLHFEILGTTEEFQAYALSLAKYSEEDLNPKKFVTGDDLLEAGFKQDKSFGETLHHMEYMQLGGYHKSRKEALEYLKELV